MIAFADQYRRDRRKVASIMRPTAQMKASEWAERYRRLSPQATASPGPWRNDYLPWLAPVLDAYDDNPWCDGWVLMKPSQIGASEVAVTFIGYLVDRAPGPILFICTNDNQARKFSRQRFSYMIESAEILKDRFLLGKSNGETTLFKMFAGGSLGMSGSGSPSQLISNPARYVFLDEEDALDDFPGMGSAREIAEKRTGDYATRVRAGIFSWAHPTFRERGVARSFYLLSDQREWCVVCPHKTCQAEIVPNWTNVEIDANVGPESAAWHCPMCGREITDLQRWRATRRGRFVSQLEHAEVLRRRFVGMHVSKMCHPRVSLADLATEWLAARSDAQLQVFWNMTMGLPHTPSSMIITSENIRDRVDKGISKNRCPRDTQFITCGVDVQKGVEDVILYYAIIAWTLNTNAIVLDLGRIRRWEPMSTMLQSFVSKMSGTDQDVRIGMTCIDYGWKTRQVYNFCRQRHGGVLCVPVKHEPHVQADNPWRSNKTYHPQHPELGGLTRVQLCRDYWIERVVNRLSPMTDEAIGGAIQLPVLTPEQINHLKAAHRRETIDKHGWARIKWAKDKTERDDWLQALVYAEVAACMMGLDQLYQKQAESTDAVEEQQREQAIETAREGFIGNRRTRSDEGGPYG